MKKNIITIIIATIIASFTTTYAQTVKPFYTEREWRTIQIKEKKRQIKEKEVPSPLREAQKAKQQRVKNTTPTDTLYVRALSAAQKAQDIVRKNTLLRINTSDTIRTLETIKWLDKYSEHQAGLAMYRNSCVYNCISIQICYHYTIAVLNDYIKDIERNCTDRDNKRLKDIRSLKSELEAGLSNVKTIIDYLIDQHEEIMSPRVQDAMNAMSDTIRLLLK